MAKMANAVVVPVFYRRVEGDQAYEIEFLPALDAFPGVDLEADTARVNSVIESAIGKSPAQYFWVHRRFKTRPDGVPGVYDAPDK